jgi:hypothetical protein
MAPEIQLRLQELDSCQTSKSSDCTSHNVHGRTRQTRTLHRTFIHRLVEKSSLREVCHISTEQGNFHCCKFCYFSLSGMMCVTFVFVLLICVARQLLGPNILINRYGHYCAGHWQHAPAYGLD